MSKIVSKTPRKAFIYKEKGGKILPIIFSNIPRGHETISDPMPSFKSFLVHNNFYYFLSGFVVLVSGSFLLHKEIIRPQISPQADGS